MEQEFPRNKKQPQDYKVYPAVHGLKTHGFKILHLFDSAKADFFEYIDITADQLEEVAQMVANSDVFRTKLGDIKQIQNLQKVMHIDRINAFLASLIGAEQYDVLNNQYFCKPPNYKMTSAHQDNAYFDSDEDVFTFWIPMQDVDMINSCMFYVPESHLKGLVEHKPIGTNVRTRTGKTGFSLYSDVYKNEDFVKVPMEAYDVLIHDKNTMHFSSANQTSEYRLAFTSIIKVNKWKKP